MTLVSRIAFKWLSGSTPVRLLALVAIGSVTLATCSVLVTAAVTAGFQKDFQEKLQGLESAITLTMKDGDPEGVGLDPVSVGADRVTPFVEGRGVVQSEGRTFPVRIIGLAPNFRTPRGLTPLDRDEPYRWDGPVALVGSELAFDSGAIISKGRFLQVVVAGGRIGPTGELEASQGRVETVGTFQTGYYENDSSTILVPYDFGRRLLGPLAPRGLRVDVDDFTRADRVMQALAARPDLQGFKISSWSEGNRRMLGILKLERMGMTLLLGLVLIVASLGMVGLLLVQATHKVHGGAVLQALGMPVRDLLDIWRWQGGWIGSIGAALGMGLAAVILYRMKTSPMAMPGSYYLETVPVLWTPVVWIIVAVGTPLLGVLMASLLKNRFLNFSPAEVLRDE